MNAGLRSHQLVKESAEEVLERLVLLFGGVNLPLNGIQNCGDFILLGPSWYRSGKCIDRTRIELGIDRVGLEFDEKLRFPKVIEVVEQVAPIDLLGGPNSENERGVDPFTFEIEISCLPDVVFAPASPVEENVALLKNRRSVALRRELEIVEFLQVEAPVERDVLVRKDRGSNGGKFGRMAG